MASMVIIEQTHTEIGLGCICPHRGKIVQNFATVGMFCMDLPDNNQNLPLCNIYIQSLTP